MSWICIGTILELYVLVHGTKYDFFLAHSSLLRCYCYQKCQICPSPRRRETLAFKAWLEKVSLVEVGLVLYGLHTSGQSDGQSRVGEGSHMTSKNMKEWTWSEGKSGDFKVGAGSHAPCFHHPPFPIPALTKQGSCRWEELQATYKKMYSAHLLSLFSLSQFDKVGLKKAGMVLRGRGGKVGVGRVITPLFLHPCFHSPPL